MDRSDPNRVQTTGKRASAAGFLHNSRKLKKGRFAFSRSDVKSSQADKKSLAYTARNYRLGRRHRTHCHRHCLFRGASAQEDSDVLDARDEPILNFLSPKPPPTRSFEPVIVSRVGKTLLHDNLASLAILPSGLAVRLRQDRLACPGLLSHENPFSPDGGRAPAESGLRHADGDALSPVVLGRKNQAEGERQVMKVTIPRPGPLG